MKYYTKDLWEKMNINPRIGSGSSSEDIMKMKREAEEQWRTNDEKYKEVFASFEDKLPKRFYKEYKNRNGFHDYCISEISIIKNTRSNKYDCFLHLSDMDNQIVIKLVDLTSFRVGVETFSTCIRGNLSWGYSEIEVSPNNTFLLSVLCDIENELTFESRSIRTIVGRRE